jgi:tight adherence protein C
MDIYSSAELFFLALVFLVASGIPIAAYFALRRNVAQRRLESLVGSAPVGTAQRPDAGNAWVRTIAKAATPLAKLSVPDEGWETSALRRRFMQAGLRSPNAPIFFFAIKTLMAFGLPLVFWLVRVFSATGMPANKFFFLIALLSGIGFYLPNLILNRMIAKRQEEIFENFPDAIDLLTICVEAGLSLEAALNRVAAELEIKSEVLAEELQLVCLEFRAGSGKERALRNLALRTGVEDIDTLVAMLVQSEKFGTSIGESLRIHSEMLRVKRQQRAEERAAKVAVKLIFPLVLCIFPAILVVVAGPAMIRIVKVLPTLVGAH